MVEDIVKFWRGLIGHKLLSEYNPNNGMITVMLSNYGDNVWSRMRMVRKEMY